MPLLVVNSDPERLWGKNPEPTPEELKEMYFTIRPLGRGNITITIPKEIDASYGTSLSYSVNGEDWIDTVIDNTAQTISIPVNNNDVYLKGISNKAWGRTQFNRTNVNLNESTTISSDVDIEVLGNPLSLFYGDNFTNNTVLPGLEYNDDYSSAFGCLFANNTHLINAEHLLIEEIGSASASFFGMFYNCSNLVKAPKNIIWTTAYSSKYYRCKYMFYGCSSLITAPIINLVNLKIGDCAEMFSGCSNLKYIKMLATDVSGSGCLINWVKDVAATGTFVKTTGVSIPTGVNGIPEGWTVEEE